MVCGGDELLHITLPVAEGSLGFGVGFGKSFAGVLRAFNLADTTPAAARARLDENRAADALGFLFGFFGALEQVAAGDDGHAGILGTAARGILVAHALDYFGRWPHEHHAAFAATAREPRVLGKEAVAGMDGGCSACDGDSQDGIFVKVAILRTRSADAICLVGELYMERVRVGRGVDGYGLDAHLLARADDAHRDLAAVGDEDLLEHRCLQNWQLFQL